MTRIPYEVGDTVDLYVPGHTEEAVVRQVTATGYEVSTRGRNGWRTATRHVGRDGHDDALAGGSYLWPPKQKPTDEQKRAARVAVDQAIRDRLAAMPCFCTPNRPELGRADYCCKHWLLKRLDRDTLAEDVQTGD